MKNIIMFSLLVSFNAAVVAENYDMSKADYIKGAWDVHRYEAGVVHTDFLSQNYNDFTTDNVFTEGTLVTDVPNVGKGYALRCTYVGNNPTLASSFQYLCVSLSPRPAAQSLVYVYGLTVTGDTLFGKYGVSTSQSDAIVKMVTGYDQVWGERKFPAIVDYSLLYWKSRKQDHEYCIDILDDAGNKYPGLSPIKCGKDMLNFSPYEYVTNVLRSPLPSGFAFRWKVWSNGANGPSYGGDGYEGRVVAY